LSIKFTEYSFSKFLRKNNKSSDEFEFMLNQLTLEEIIALKLEIVSRSISGKLYGFNLWSNIPRIAKEGLLLFAISATTNMVEAQTLLGISNSLRFTKILYRHRESLRHYKVVDLPDRNYLFQVRERSSLNRIKKENKEDSPIT